MKKRIPLHWKIIAGLVLGIIYGLAAVKFGWADFTEIWIKPWGTIFINLLKVIAVPLILASLINGISNLNDTSKLSRIGLKTIIFYLSTTVIAITLGLILVNITNPGHVFPEAKRIELQAIYAQNVQQGQNSAGTIEHSSPLQFLVDMVPSNIFSAMGQNGQMLQVIFFAIIFGIAMVSLPQNKVKPVKSFIESANTIILRLIDMIMLFAPYGVFALLSSVVVSVSGDNMNDTFSLFASLGLYGITVIIGLFLMIFVVYPIILMIFTKVKYKNFYRGIFPAQLLAFSTSSSAATLPLSMEVAEKRLGIDQEVTSFVLPVGATINMDGTSIYQAVAAVFIAQVYGMDLDLSQQLTIVFTAVLASIGSAAVPGAGIVMLVIVLTAIGVPTEGVALIFALDRLLDMFRTVVNITGDNTVACIIGASEKKIDYSIANAEKLDEQPQEIIFNNAADKDEIGMVKKNL
ncbi:MAG: dicarboxylate/amino acid:cation symporter [Bacteroidales bacterium]